MDPPMEVVAALARDAMRAAEREIPAYSHPRSPRAFTQRQLFALLAVRRFLDTDFRTVASLAARSPELREALGLERSPHYSTLWYAERRLLAGGAHEALMREVLERARGPAARRPGPPDGADPAAAGAQVPLRLECPVYGPGIPGGPMEPPVRARPTFVGDFVPPLPGPRGPDVS